MSVLACAMNALTSYDQESCKSVLMRWTTKPVAFLAWPYQECQAFSLNSAYIAIVVSTMMDVSRSGIASGRAGSLCHVRLMRSIDFETDLAGCLACEAFHLSMIIDMVHP